MSEKTSRKKDSVLDFLYLWAAILVVNQIFIFGACFQPYCIIAAIPHTFALAALGFFGYRRYVKD